MYGADWVVTSGIESCVSQISKKSRDARNAFVWNFPIEISFKSTNPHGWPRITLAAYGLDSLGRDVVRGYGSAPLPLAAGQHTRRVPMFVPIASNTLQAIAGLVFGARPEFRDEKFVASGSGREVARVRTQGEIVLQLHMLSKDFAQNGYAAGPRR